MKKTYLLKLKIRDCPITFVQDKGVIAEQEISLNIDPLSTNLLEVGKKFSEYKEALIEDTVEIVIEEIGE